MRRAFGSVSVCVVVLALLASSASAIGVGTVAPEVGPKDISGQPVSISSLRGKVVLVDFWASWCAPCKQELPILEKLYKKYQAKGFAVVAVNQDQSVDNAKGFLRRTPLSFRVVHDQQGTIAGRYGPAKMPSSYLIDRKGLVRYVQAGFKAADAPELEKQIVKLLDAK